MQNSLTVRRFRWVTWIATQLLVLVASCWTVLALYFYTPLDYWFRVGLAVACAIWFLCLRAFGRTHARAAKQAVQKSDSANAASNAPRSVPTDAWSLTRWGLYVATVAAVALAWWFVKPSDDGDWSRLHAAAIEAEFEGDRASLRNVRSTEYNQDGTYEVFYHDRELDLNQVETVWFGVQQFVSWRGGSHTFVSFGFADGQYLAISVEARRGEGDDFHPLRGMFKQCGLIYVVGSEMDIIGNRVAEAKYPIYLYPMRATQTQVREMLQSMLRRADGLRKRPEFYHTTLNNCTTNIVDSFNQIAPTRISPHSLRVKFPGYSGEVAYRQGLIDSDAPFEEVQKMARINDRGEGATPDNFSTLIRSGFER